MLFEQDKAKECKWYTKQTRCMFCLCVFVCMYLDIYFSFFFVLSLNVVECCSVENLLPCHLISCSRCQEPCYFFFFVLYFIYREIHAVEIRVGTLGGDFFF